MGSNAMTYIQNFIKMVSVNQTLTGERYTQHGDHKNVLSLLQNKESRQKKLNLGIRIVDHGSHETEGSRGIMPTKQKIAPSNPFRSTDDVTRFSALSCEGRCLVTVGFKCGIPREHEKDRRQTNVQIWLMCTMSIRAKERFIHLCLSSIRFAGRAVRQ